MTRVTGVLLLAFSLACAEPTALVKTPLGVVQGQVKQGVDEFLGIPFAAPPVGALRFANPEPVASWDGVLNVTTWKDDCPQHSPDYPNYAEDCLYLNVWRPSNTSNASAVATKASAADAPLPVALYFCGGGFVHCGAYRPDGNIWAGDSFVRTSAALGQPVIVVTINYRVTVFGYLGGAAFRSLNDNNSTGNAGTYDQLAALQWVNANIASFGGDPGRVSIFGESAGAGSVSNMLALAPAAGLFHGAIIESGAPMSWTSQSSDEAEVNLHAMAAAVGCHDEPTLVSCMQSADMDTLLTAADRNASFSIKHLAHPPWTPVVDGVTFPDAPDRMAQRLNVTRVPMVVGANANEGTMFALALPRNLTAVQYTEFLVAVFGTDSVKVGLKFLSFKYPSPWWAAAAVVGSYEFRCPARRAARRLSTPETPVWLYRFNFLPSYIKAADLGVEHSAELIFVWRFLALLDGADELDLSRQMVTYWSTFFSRQNPNDHTLLAWPQYDNSTDISMTFNSTLKLGTAIDDSVCDFWDDMYTSESSTANLRRASMILRSPAMMREVVDHVMSV